MSGLVPNVVRSLVQGFISAVQRRHAIVFGEPIQKDMMRLAEVAYEAGYNLGAHEEAQKAKGEHLALLKKCNLAAFDKLLERNEYLEKKLAEMIQMKEVL